MIFALLTQSPIVHTHTCTYLVHTGIIPCNFYLTTCYSFWVCMFVYWF